jgi:hypothetical protein
MDDPFEATIEATINSLINNHDMVGADENFVPALPLDKLINNASSCNWITLLVEDYAKSNSDTAVFSLSVCFC